MAHLGATEIAQRLGDQSYVADRGLASALSVAFQLRRPLFLEGEAGVGKTEAAKAFATAIGARLIRLQCYEGIDVDQALYDWNYARQMLHMRAVEARDVEADGADEHVFGPDFLLRRPLLDAIDNEDAVPRCCSSTRSTAPTRSSRPSCSRFSPTSRSASPSWARSWPRGVRW